MKEVAEIAVHAGPLALAAFAGTFLGGLALSFFWKNFGPWKLLESCEEECNNCREQRESDAKEMSKMVAEYSDLAARYAILLQAVERGGMGLQLGQQIQEVQVVTTIVPGLDPLTNTKPK